MSESKVIQFSHLGRYGRFGNQMFQYAFARAYAEKYGATLQIPPWIGEKIFKNVSHQHCSGEFPVVRDDKIPWGETNINLYGYFQTKECFDILSESKLRKWFVFQDKWLEFLSLQKSDDVIAHLRRGDYITKSALFCVISRESYLLACEKFGINKEKIIWLSEENPTIEQRMSDVCYKKFIYTMYGSKTCYDDKGASFLPDFFRMVNAKVLLRGNSTFSLWAAFFNKDKIFSPVVGNHGGKRDVEFVEGNWPKLNREVSDFLLNS